MSTSSKEKLSHQHCFLGRKNESEKDANAELIGFFCESFDQESL
jgi:hypothetical protein